MKKLTAIFSILFALTGFAAPPQVLYSVMAGTTTPAQLYPIIPNTSGGILVSNGPNSFPSFQAASANNLMFSQSAIYSAATVGAKLQQIVSVNDAPYNADSTGVIDSHSAIQTAINNATPGTAISFNGTYNLGTVGITIPTHNVTIIGNQSTLNYGGSGHAFDAVLVSGTIYPQYLELSDLNIICKNTCLSAIRWRFSYSIAKNVTAIVTASTSTAWRIDTDFTGGTGPYYNEFLNDHAIGKVGVIGGVTNQTGWLFTTDPGYPTRGPNANTFFPGRTSAVSNPWVIAGTKNRIIGPTVEGTVSGGTVFTFQNVYGGTSGCSYNDVLYPYVEGASGANFVLFGANATYNHVSRPYVTSIGAGAYVTDTSGSTTNTLENESGYQFANQATTDTRTLNWYEQGVFTPVLVGQTTGGTQTYSTQSGKFTRIGNKVFFAISIDLSAFDATTLGNLKITGLPYAAKAATNDYYIIPASGTMTLSAGYTWFNGRIDPGNNFVWLIQNGSGVTASIMTATSLLTHSEIYITGEYGV